MDKGKQKFGGGTSAPELIWANPTKVQQFLPQTINENSSGWVSGKHFSDYDAFIIASVNYYSGPVSLVMNYITDASALTDISSLYKKAITHYNAAPYRDITLSSSGIGFAACNTGNAYMIPYYIWGIKNGSLSYS